MFGRREDVGALRAELAEVTARIAAHRLASDRIRAAHAVVDERRCGEPGEIDAALAADGLPSATDLGRAQVAGTWSWWKLHRRRTQLQKRIERALPR
ncbi:hypothetical protein [Modestobacter sp. SYSU DS0511]